MKTFTFLVLMILCNSFYAQPSADESFDHNKTEKQEIISVIKTESIAYYQGKYDQWKSKWTQNENSVCAWNKADGTYEYFRGWKSINAFFEDNIKNRNEVKYPDFNVGQLSIEVSGDFAIVVYNEYVANVEMKYSRVPGVKTLHKENNQWKLHTIVSFWDRDYQFTKSEVQDFVQGSGFDSYK